MKKFFANHWKLWVAVAAGVVTYVFLPPAWTTLTRTLVGWNVTVLLLLAVNFTLVTRLNSAQLHERYQDDDPSAPLILVLVVVAAILSVAAIVAFLTTLKGVPPSEKAAHVVLATVTVVGSWLLVPTIYALHYADMYYSAPKNGRPLVFPGTDAPVYWDFVYFSYTIAAACQTADVSTQGVPIRRTVVAHSLISVLFNVSILGFAINVTAGLLA